ncbi:MAG: hypothetical protein AAF206_07145 [Bacteroidota bacterium]
MIDLKFIQDFSIKTGAKTHTLQLTADIFNFTNMLNNNWGRRYFVGSFGSFELLDFEGFQNETEPTFSFDGVDENFPNDNIDDTGIQSSRWQMQLGVRYLFK